jgi:NTP pyrophosphatase (non-canonical NTP hydrolase)
LSDEGGESEVSEEKSFRDFLEEALSITDEWEKLNGRWSYNDQIAHTHSEVSEVFQAVKHGEGRQRELEEITDAVLAALTMAHVWRFSNRELMQQFERTLDKLRGRIAERKAAPAKTQEGPP